MPTQFHTEHSSIPDLGQGGDDRGKIDFALAEFEVLVPAGARIVDVDIGEAVAIAVNLRLDGRLSLAM
jgi:hypothetical protein